MKKSPLTLYVSLRESLLKRQAELAEELSLISAALGSPNAPASTAAKPARTRKQARNAVSLLEAVLTVTKSKPLPKREILAAIGKLGYSSRAKDPMNSLNTTLYTNKKIKNFGGAFGPA
ncbi:MAG: hypothetical protein U1G08_07785 [Verrucomicrobiota bacterium]